MPNLYATHQINEKLWLGLGVYSPFGLGNFYDESWSGRYNVYSAQITCVEANPSLSVKVTDKVSLSAGLGILYFETEAKSKISPRAVAIQGIMSTGLPLEDAVNVYASMFAPVVDALPDIDQAIKVDKTALRFNLAAHVDVTDQLSFGFHYRSGANLELEGDATFTSVPEIELFNAIYSAPISAELSLPDTYVAGVAFKPIEKLTLEADIVHTRWAKYDELKYTFENGIGTVTQPKDWENVNCYRFGAEYQVTEAIALRGGYLFDEEPITDTGLDYSLPGNDRNMFTAGIGYSHGKLTLDAHYALVLMKERDIRRNESIFIYQDSRVEDAVTHQFGINISYAL